jgi:chaperonin GroES
MNEAPIQPTGRRVLLRRLEAPKQQSGMIVIPDSAVPRSQRFGVVAVGPGEVQGDVWKFVAEEIKIGSVVLMGRYGGAEVELDGKEYLLVHEDEILAILQ